MRPPPPTPAAERSGAASLHASPGTGFERTWRLPAGTVLTITGRNQADDWRQLTNGAWIAGFLVDNAPQDLPIMNAAPVAAPTPALPAQAGAAT